MRFTNVLLWVQENFYKKIGFEVDVSTDTHSEMHLGAFKLTLVSMRDEEEFTSDSLSGAKGKGMYIYIHVDDVDQVHRELQSKGIVTVTEPRDWPWGNREFVMKDPDGYKICFWHTATN